LWIAGIAARARLKAISSQCSYTVSCIQEWICIQCYLGRCALARVITVALGAIAAAPVSAQNLTPRIVVGYPADAGIPLGAGWNTWTLQKTSAICVVADIKSDSGDVSQLVYKRVLDQESLMRALSLSAEIKANALMGGSFSSSASFARTVKISEENVNISGMAVVEKGAEYLVPRSDRAATQPSADLHGAIASANTATTIADRDLALLRVNNVVNAGAIRLSDQYERLANSNLAEFRRLCGYGFVASIVSGGSIDLVYSFHTRTVEEKEEIVASMSGSFPNLSGSASAKSVVEKYSRNSKVTIFYRRSGGSGDPLPLTEAELNSVLQGLPKSVADAPKPIRFSVISYADLPNFPRIPSEESRVLDEIVSAYFRFSSIRFNIDRMLQNAEDYLFAHDVTPQTVKGVQDEIETARLRLSAAAATCVETRQCSFPSGIPASDYEFRSQLPVASGSFSVDSDLRAATSRLASLRREYERAPACIELSGVPIRFDPRDCRPGGRMENPSRVQLRIKIQKQEIDVAQLQRRWPRALLEERFRFWIDEPARTRCVELYDERCFLNEQMEAIRSRMYLKAGIAR
jgi:hypothetical protein